ncbi:MAG: xanthine dehydrogenase accessory protein XdhC [Paracoccaceae bacterium]
MIDRAEIAELVERHGRVTRVVICAHQGSSPREAGAAMLVWADGQSGTIGGGALEFDAAQRARALKSGRSLDSVALGPSLGQCCGGAVTLGYEVFDAATVSQIPQSGLFTRAFGSADMPLAMQRAMKAARGEGAAGLRFAQGWLAEPVAPKRRDLWIWGAGHVGRALVSVMAPLPGVAITWIDTDRSRFPAEIPAGVTARIAQNPASLVADAPAQAEHLILTFSHALDLELCHRLLAQGFGACGLIGSQTKWARFRNRLQALGHEPAEILRIRCPIGDPGLGKHPQAIAISVASSFLTPTATARHRESA